MYTELYIDGAGVKAPPRSASTLSIQLRRKSSPPWRRPRSQTPTPPSTPRKPRFRNGRPVRRASARRFCARSSNCMTARLPDFARLITLENGKARADAMGEAAYAAEFFRWFAEEAVRADGLIVRAPASGARIVVQHKPAGVAALVTPWNFPAAMGTRKIAPALAAGCPVIIKPASATPLTMLALAPLFEEAGVPKGIVNVLPSRKSGALIDHLLHDPRVRVISFTGSTEVGPQTVALGGRLRCDSGDGARRQRAGDRFRGRRHRDRGRRAPWWPRCATWARPARRPTGSMFMRAWPRPSRVGSRKRWPR